MNHYENLSLIEVLEHLEHLKSVPLPLPKNQNASNWEQDYINFLAERK
jgi:hypothetical protein